MRKSTLKALKALNDKAKTARESNALMASPHLSLQGSRDGLRRERGESFFIVSF